MTLPVVYLAAPLSAPTREGVEANRRAALAWAVWIERTFDVAVECSWIAFTEVLDETPENRERGLRNDCARARLCAAFAMVGPRVSDGMQRESEAARAVVDWTGIELDDVQTTGDPWGMVARMRAELFAAIEGARP